MKPLWECPRCGAKLVTRNLSHACGDYSIEKFLAGKPPAGRDLFRRFEKLIAACGPYLVAPAKTRIAFMDRLRFASVNRVGETGIDVHFVLPYPLTSARFKRVEKVGNCHVHHLRLAGPESLDGELQGWLRESYSEYGSQKQSGLRPRPSPRARE